MYHVPNGGKRSKSEAARFRAMGVKAGVPDMIAPYNGLYIELKRQRGGTVSAAQKQWDFRLAHRRLCRGSLQGLGICRRCHYGVSGGAV